jgi:hypothetical protein
MEARPIQQKYRVTPGVRCAQVLSILWLLVLVISGGGCSSGGSSSTEHRSAALEDYPKGPTREFIIPGGNNRVQVYGREATTAERRKASALLHRWMRAREARDFETDCKYLSRRLIKGIVADAESATRGRVETCAATLAYLGPTASGDYKNTLGNLPIVSFRVGSGFGYAQYHGLDGNDWIVPMNRERGRWLVGLPSPADRNE